jgi:hypothetical protein
MMVKHAASKGSAFGGILYPGNKLSIMQNPQTSASPLNKECRSEEQYFLKT